MNADPFVNMFIAGSLLLTMFAFFLIYFIVFQRRKMNSFNAEKQKMLVSYQHEMIKEQEMIMDELSKEVHDNIIHIASFVRMHLRMIEKMTKGEDVLKMVRKASSLTDQLISDEHNISHLLSADFVKGQGLYKTLLSEMEHISATKKIKCNIEIQENIPLLNAEVELVIFRIAQQAIGNMLKHAHATELNIKITYQDDTFCLFINDNGIGFDVDLPPKKQGIGFLNMHRRAAFLNGTLNITASPGNGCAIELLIPRTTSPLS